MWDTFQKFHAIAARRWDIMPEIDHHQRRTPAPEHSHYKWTLPWPKPQRRHQKLILLTYTGSSWTPAQPQNGISSNLSISAIILGSPNPYYNKLMIKFGAYVQVYIGTINSTKQITVGAIAPRPENERDGYYFMSLSTRKQLHAFIWTELPINYQVISRLND